MQNLKLDIKVRPKLKTYSTQCVLKLEILELGKLKLRTCKLIQAKYVLCFSFVYLAKHSYINLDDWKLIFFCHTYLFNSIKSFYLFSKLYYKHNLT